MKFRPLLALTLPVVSLGLAVSAGACANGGGIDGGAGGVGGQGASVTTGTKSGSTTTSAQSTTGTTSTSKSSTAAGMATNSSADSSSATSTGVGGPMCTDPGPGEPNDTMATAFNLGTIGDADGEGKSVSGMLDQTGNDVDWYKFHGDDNFFATVDPTRQLFGPVRICKYIECTDGTDPGVGCPSGTTADTQGGKHGCCWKGGAEVTLDFGCSTAGAGDDSLNAWIRIDQPGGAGCETYKFDYHM